MRRAEALLSLIVVLIGSAAVIRYINLIREHPEAKTGFEVLLAVSFMVLAVFIIGLLYIRGKGEL